MVWETRPQCRAPRVETNLKEMTMADEKLRETVFGKRSRFDVFEVKWPLQATKYYINKNGSYHRGTFSRLDDAVAAAQSDARKEG